MLPEGRITMQLDTLISVSINVSVIWATTIMMCANLQYIPRNMHTVFALLCFVVVIHWLIFPYPSGFTSLALWQSNDCPSASKATLMNMDKYFMWIHYERLHNHNKAKHNKTVCIFLGIYCINLTSVDLLSVGLLETNTCAKSLQRSSISC